MYSKLSKFIFDSMVKSFANWESNQKKNVYVCVIYGIYPKIPGNKKQII